MYTWYENHFVKLRPFPLICRNSALFIHARKIIETPHTALFMWHTIIHIVEGHSEVSYNTSHFTAANSYSSAFIS